MKMYFPVLAVLLGLGSSISSAQIHPPKDPFDRYLAETTAGKREPAFVRFSQECGIDLGASSVRYATRPDNEWKRTRDLSNALDGLETDFFATVAVNTAGEKSLVEMWTMELDVGIESRTFYCLDNQKVTRIEATEWTLPVTDEEEKTNPGWGYKQLWNLAKSGKFQRTQHGFVDWFEIPMNDPSLDIETRKALDWEPKIHLQTDLKLPLWLWKL